MTQEPQPRPGQATLAGALIIGGSIIVVLTAWQRISSLHTLEAQEGLRQALSERPFEALGLSLQTLSTTVRVLCMIAAGAATAATILGFQVFKRSRSARIALTALAPLLLVGGFATDGFFAPMVVAGITLLWLQPTRDWYAGRPWLQRYEQRRAERLAALRSSSRSGGPGGSDKATGGPQQGGLQQAEPQQPGPGVPYPPPPPAHGGDSGDARGARPPGLVWACSLAWITSGMVLLGIVLAIVGVALQGDQLVAEVKEQQGDVMESYGVTDAQVLASVYVLLVGFALWAIAALVLAWLTFTGRNWARITLAVSSAVATVVALLMSVGNPVLVVLVAVLAVSTWLLLRPDVAAWFRR